MPKTQRLSDAALVRRSQQGDRRAFGALVTRYDRRLRGLAYALLLDPAQMDAALGLAYLRSWRDVLRIKPRDDVGPWLYRAVYNSCIDQLRRNEAPSGSRPTPVEVPPGAPGGFRDILGTLAPADRVALVLVERERFSVSSAARILGVTPDELETRLDVARDRLTPYVVAPAPSPEADEGATRTPARTPAEDHEPAPAGTVSGNGAEEHDDQGDADEAHVDAPAHADTPSADVPSPDPQIPDGAPDTGTAAPGGPSAAPTEEEEPAPAAPAAKANGHGANRGRGRRARRRANGARREANGTATPTTTPAGGTDGTEPANGTATPTTTPAGGTDGTEPANGETASDAADAARPAGAARPADTADTAEPSVGDDGSAHPAGAAPSAGEHRAADR
jgi:RNA polymerase sigma-70 factor, ECF subfamily